MVIAIMGDTFARVKDKQEVEDMEERLMWISWCQFQAFWDRTPCLVYIHTVKNAFKKKENEGVVVNYLQQLGED